jgi:phosphopantothenoylcysteine synthetase/decarboxylase
MVLADRARRARFALKLVTLHLAASNGFRKLFLAPAMMVATWNVKLLLSPLPTLVPPLHTRWIPYSMLIRLQQIISPMTSTKLL